MARCGGSKPTGAPCERIVPASQDYCYSHDPARADARQRAARKGGRRGGRGRPLTEVANLKELLGTLVERVVDRVEADEDYLSPGRGAVAAQLLNTRLRAIELERKIREEDELLERIEALEGPHEGPSRTYGR